MGSLLKALLVLAVPMFLISSLIMFVLNFITISEAVLPAFRHFEDEEVLAQRKTHWENIAPQDTLAHLVWFLQITDLHVSEYVDGQRILQLEEFCTETVDAVQPAVVIASGDLTDAKTLGNFGSEQREWEWKEYSRIIKETKVTERTVWLDIRGNHDTFNVPSRDSKLNYYKTHSQRGNGTSYHHVHSYGPDTLSFIGVDACPDPGFRRPFNFFGVLTEDDMKHLEGLARDSRKSNVTIWFGHYPTSVISSAAPGITHIMGGGVAYLSGHLHTLGGLLPELYAMQKSGTLELELGDWKDNRLFRLMAVDHDLFSFADVNFNDWPIGLITNPKNVRFFAPVHEPLNRISRSTHVRVVAFSPSGIQSVEIQLPDENFFRLATQVPNSNKKTANSNKKTANLNEKTANLNEKYSDLNNRNSDLNEKKYDLNNKNSDLNEKNSDLNEKNSDLNKKNSDLNEKNSDLNEKKSSLYIVPWDASRYAVGTHTIRCRITDKNNRRREIIQDFATREGEVPTFNFLRRLVLMADLGKLFATLTFGVAFSNLFVLSIFGTNAIKTVYGIIVKHFEAGRQAVPLGVMRDLHTALSLRWVFWPLFFNTAYVLIMPWFYGEIVEGSYGIVFTFGIWMEERAWLHGQMTYMFAVTHLILHCVPLSLCTALYVRSRIRHPAKKVSRFFYHLIYFILIISQIWSLRIFSDSYGVLSIVTNGLLVWSGIVPTLFLWWKSWNMPNTVKYAKVETRQ